MSASLRVSLDRIDSTIYINQDVHLNWYLHTIDTSYKSGLTTLTMPLQFVYQGYRVATQFYKDIQV